MALASCHLIRSLIWLCSHCCLRLLLYPYLVFCIRVLHETFSGLKVRLSVAAGAMRALPKLVWRFGRALSMVHMKFELSMVSPLVGQMKNNFVFSSNLHSVTKHVTTVALPNKTKKNPHHGKHIATHALSKAHFVCCPTHTTQAI